MTPDAPCRAVQHPILLLLLLMQLLQSTGDSSRPSQLAEMFLHHLLARAAVVPLPPGHSPQLAGRLYRSLTPELKVRREGHQRLPSPSSPTIKPPLQALSPSPLSQRPGWRQGAKTYPHWNNPLYTPPSSWFCTHSAGDEEGWVVHLWLGCGVFTCMIFLCFCW